MPRSASRCSAHRPRRCGPSSWRRTLSLTLASSSSTARSAPFAAREDPGLAGHPTSAGALFLAFARSCGAARGEILEQPRRRLHHRFDGALDLGGDGLAWLTRRDSAHLPNVLQRGGADLFRRGRWLEMVKNADVAAHGRARTRTGAGLPCQRLRPLSGSPGSSGMTSRARLGSVRHRRACGRRQLVRRHVERGRRWCGWRARALLGPDRRIVVGFHGERRARPGDAGRFTRGRLRLGSSALAVRMAPIPTRKTRATPITTPKKSSGASEKRRAIL